ncbi:hypothetical protein ACFW04_012057 [Cataglyphis niger]
MRDVATSIAGRKQLKHKININSYNPVLFTAWEGNMAIQFIEKNELSDTILDSKNNKNKSLASYRWNIALRFTNNRECGAPEAADTLLGIPLYGTYQNTTVKWLDKLKLSMLNLQIFYSSLIDNHYPHRPNELENMSLYEFAQWYNISKIKLKNEDIEYYKINNGYYLKRRQRGYLINHYRYGVNTQPENYFFSLLLMSQPWRKLEDIKKQYDTYAESFHKVKLHLVEALQYHTRLKKLQKAFETAKVLVQQCLDDDLQKQQLPDDPENPIGVQYIQAGEAMQDFKDFVFDRVINTVNSNDKSILKLNVSGEGGTGKILRADLKDVILFVTDKVSIISNLILMYIHFQLSEIFDTSDCDDGWFGQKHILLFGDLLQLPPVHENRIFMRLPDEKTILFDYDKLTINMRQQGGDSYRELLSRIRNGLLTKSDNKIFENRKISFERDSFESRLNELCNFIDNLPSDTVCLLPTCHMSDVLNDAMLNCIVLKKMLLIAKDTIKCIPYVKKVLKVFNSSSNNDDDYNSRTAGLSKQITIKIRAKIMIRRNIDASFCLVNGTIATVISIVQNISTDYVEKINFLYHQRMLSEKFPLSLSYEITFHKSQGLNLQSAIMDIGNSAFNCNQVYVALSQVTSLKGLHLINYDPSSIIVNEEAIEYNRLKAIHKPKADRISVLKERYRKVKDVLWALPKVITSVQKSDEKIRQSNTWVIHGFQNTDEISCYANTQLFNCDISDVLRILMHRCENAMHNLNTYVIRQCLGEFFKSATKRNASDFLIALCEKYDCIKNLIEHLNDKLMKTQKFNLCSVPTTKVLLARQFHKTMNAILYHDLCIDEGHYISICREESSSIWIKADDAQIKKVSYKRMSYNVLAIL